MTTPSRASGSGPKKETNAPFKAGAVSLGMAESRVKAEEKPPWAVQMKTTTRQMPPSMMIPCTRSLSAAAI